MYVHNDAFDDMTEVREISDPKLCSEIISIYTNLEKVPSQKEYALDDLILGPHPTLFLVFRDEDTEYRIDINSVKDIIDYRSDSSKPNPLN